MTGKGPYDRVYYMRPMSIVKTSGLHFKYDSIIVTIVGLHRVRGEYAHQTNNQHEDTPPI